MKEYITFYTSGGKKIIKNDRIKHIEEQFKSHSFIRVHKSFLVSINHISAFFGNTIEIGVFNIPVGRVYKDDVKNLLIP